MATQPLQYYFQRNPLLSELGYTARVITESIGTEAIANAINAKNPTTSIETVKTFIADFREVVTDNLANGKRVNIDDFMRFVPSIVGNYPTPTSTVSKSDVQVNCVASSNLIDDVRSEILFSRQPYIEKRPVVAQFTSSTAYHGYLSGIISLKGNYLEFDTSVEDEGVFIKNTNTEVENQAYEFAVITDGSIIMNIPTLTDPIENGYREYEVYVRTRYTPTGTLREAKYPLPVRTINPIVTANLDNTSDAGIFKLRADDLNQEESKLEAATYSAPGDIYNFYIKLNPLSSGVLLETSQMELSVGIVNAVGTVSESTPVVITTDGTGQSVTLPCSIAGVGAIGNLTEVVTYSDDYRSLGTAINQVYGGTYYEYIQLDDSANLPP